MQSTTATRKRPAPGAIPITQQPTPPTQNYAYPQMPDNPYVDIDFSQNFGSDQILPEPTVIPNEESAHTVSESHLPLNNGDSKSMPAPSTDLVRRTWDQQLTAHPNGQQQEQWTESGAYDPDGPTGEEDEQNLEIRVESAKRDAQGKRKQIPPFVQKLSSFLDSSHTELIRWSDDGRSLIVLDEDEFARTLIPELFKHNNYASFVRQLNMYGFHKTVNITDGSLRQSEKARKGVKPPSMYSHPYFRKNRPDLLWLIQKPAGKSGAKRKRDGNLKGDFDDDDERQYSPAVEGIPHELGAPRPRQDLAALPRNELVAVRQELRKLQSQQHLISQMISQLQSQNDQFYRQATAFQALHDRHENSINAILTFLATFYNRSVEGHGAQDLVNMFANQAQKSQQQGSVVEEFIDTPNDNGQQFQRYTRRQPLLLKGPESTSSPRLRPESAGTQPNSTRASASPAGDESNRGSTTSAPQERAHKVNSIRDAASPTIMSEGQTPDLFNQVPESDQMMSLIHDVNATNAQASPDTAAPSLDFLNDFKYPNGNLPLTPQQRDDMLALIANQPGSDPNNTTAILSPQPQMPSMSSIEQTKRQLEVLQKLQTDAGNRIQELRGRVSPSGSIPGLGRGENDDPFDVVGSSPGNFDMSAYVNSDDAEFARDAGDMLGFDFDQAADTGDIDWSYGANDGADMFSPSKGADGRLAPPKVEDGGGKVESLSSEATTPAATILSVDEEPGLARKRAKRL